MEYLYVCHFSNGHIKVGRSIDPVSRIASHVDRVGCMGVELIEHCTFECAGLSVPGELILINRCVDACDRRYKNEWFTGLDYLQVCEWANDAAAHIPTTQEPSKETFGTRLTAARRAKGLTQAQLGQGMGTDGVSINKAAISGWELDNYLPNVRQLRLICERLGVSADSLIFGATVEV